MMVNHHLRYLHLPVSSLAHIQHPPSNNHSDQPTPRSSSTFASAPGAFTKLAVWATQTFGPPKSRKKENTASVHKFPTEGSIKGLYGKAIFMNFLEVEVNVSQVFNINRRRQHRQPSMKHHVFLNYQSHPGCVGE